MTGARPIRDAIWPIASNAIPAIPHVPPTIIPMRALIGKVPSARRDMETSSG